MERFLHCPLEKIRVLVMGTFVLHSAADHASGVLSATIIELPHAVPQPPRGWQLAHHCSWNLFSSAASRFFLPSSLHHALRLLAHVLLHLGSCVIFLFFVLSSLSYKPLSAGVPGPGALLKRDRIHFLSPLHTHLLFHPVMLLFFLSKYLFFFF